MISNQKIQKKWQQYKQEIDSKLIDLFKKQAKEIASFDVEIKKAWKNLEKVVLASGKRFRPFLFLWSANLKGKKEREILPVALALELVHSYFLIHDDIIDRDNIRHGVETLHEVYRKNWNKIEKKNKESVHFGNSIALLMGDWLNSMALGLIVDSSLNDRQKVIAVHKIIKLENTTIYGETLDVLTSLKHKYSTKEFYFKALEIVKTKTAYYTFIAPLELGVLLGKKSKEERELFIQIGLELGKIYQWQDDIQGIFEESKKLGKPSGSDLRENKPTLLILKTIKSLNQSDRKKFLSLVGKKLSTKEIDNARKLIIKSGEKEKLEEKILKSKNNLIKTVTSSKLEKSRKQEFIEIIEWVVGRKK